MRAYFVEDASAAEVAQRFGYAASTVVAMVRDFTPDADADQVPISLFGNPS